MMQHKAEPMCRAGERFVISPPQPTDRSRSGWLQELVRLHTCRPSRWRRTDQRCRDQRIGEDLSSGSSANPGIQYSFTGGKDDLG
jgi:hypothetical protein